MNFPSITDNADSLWAVIGISMLFYSLTGFEHISSEHGKIVAELYSLQDSITKTEKEEERIPASILEKSNRIYLETGVSNPLYAVNDSTVAIDYTLEFDSSQLYIKRAYYEIWDEYVQLRYSQTLKVLYLRSTLNRITERKNTMKSDRFSKGVMMAFGCAFIILGGFGLRQRSIREKMYSKYQERANGPLLNLCQSCGREFNSIVKIGSYADGSPSYSLCQDCFKDGQFRHDDTEAWGLIEQQVQDMVGSEQDKKNEIEKRRKLERWSTKKPLGHKTI